jgi:hypothetical protein
MNTCGTCKHLGDERELTHYDSEGDDLPDTKYRVCGLLKHLNEHGSVSQRVAGVIDGSGYFAAFCVTEDFGCNQWSARDTAAEPKRGS